MFEKLELGVREKGGQQEHESESVRRIEGLGIREPSLKHLRNVVVLDDRGVARGFRDKVAAACVGTHRLRIGPNLDGQVEQRAHGRDRTNELADTPQVLKRHDSPPYQTWRSAASVGRSVTSVRGASLGDSLAFRHAKDGARDRDELEPPHTQRQKERREVQGKSIGSSYTNDVGEVHDETDTAC